MRRNVIFLLVCALLMNVLTASQASIAAGTGLATASAGQGMKCSMPCCEGNKGCCAEKSDQQDGRETSALPTAQSRLIATFTVLAFAPVTGEQVHRFFRMADVSAFCHSPPPRLRSGIQLI
jgi:hypothetical protein